MSSNPLSKRLDDIKRMLRLLRDAVYALFGIASLILIVYVVGALAVNWLTGRDFNDAFVFPGVVVLSFNQALGIVGAIALIFFGLLQVGKKMEEMDDKLASIGLSLEYLEPLVKEGRVLWEYETERELDLLDKDLDPLDIKRTDTV